MSLTVMNMIVGGVTLCLCPMFSSGSSTSFSLASSNQVNQSNSYSFHFLNPNLFSSKIWKRQGMKATHQKRERLPCYV